MEVHHAAKTDHVHKVAGRTEGEAQAQGQAGKQDDDKPDGKVS